jgi:hypothetical protein
VPTQCKFANVIPIPKSSLALDVDSDFRPDRLQFGSLKGSNTTKALYLLHKWYEAMNTPDASL